MCGITGVISNSNINHILYESLFHIQHRGQNSYGFALLENKDIKTIKNSSFININPHIKSNMGLGHVRYPTCGIIDSNEIQPFVCNNIALCHNGTISNYNELYQEYSDKIMVNSKSDSELVLHIFNYELSKKR